MFDFVKAHAKLATALVNSIKNVTNSHAYIFEGATGIGKEQVAKYFATCLCCENIQNTPCGKCSLCIKSNTDNNPDIITLSMENKISNTKSIGVDDIRSIISAVYIKPFSSEKKVYIIADGEKMTEQAQNALLKILEEPPHYAVFILLTTSMQKILPTIRSRAEKLLFSPIDKALILNYISSHYPNIKQNEAEFIARYCNGNVGIADNIAQNDDFKIVRQGAIKFLPNLFSTDTLKILDLSDFFVTNANEQQLIIDLWISMLRDMLFMSLEIYEKVVNVDIINQIEHITYLEDVKDIYIAINSLLKLKDMLNKYVNARAAILNVLFSK